MKKLPVGVQTFQKIIEGGYVYADKTRHIYDLATQGQYFFLSRPRRFGKSLLVDTMKEAFSGNRALFSGLDLGETDFDFTPSPVIRLDMSALDNTTPENLRLGISSALTDIAATYGVQAEDPVPATQLRRLIEGLRAATGRHVTVLIDEYDKPIIDHLHEPSVAENNRVELRSLYGVLKATDAHLRFVFLTGVSKFTRLSLFSQLNNLSDITLNPRFATICGFTETDFGILFSDRLENLSATRRARGLPDADPVALRDRIFTWYDGYSWDGANRVFNPFSLLRFFQDEVFFPYWYTSGVPQFLVGTLRRDPVQYAQLEGATITEVDLDSHEIERAPLISLLFQTGFLTVTSVDLSYEPLVYELGFPNLEVSQSFSGWYLDTIAADSPVTAQSWAVRVRRALDQGNPDELEGLLGGLFASIPYQLHRNSEALYHAVFLATMTFLGFRMLGEVSVAGGRIDGTIDTSSGKAYVVEMKYVPCGDDADPAEIDRVLGLGVADALAQIEAKRYADAYQGTGKTVFNVGIAVTGRGIVKVQSTPPAPH